MQKNDQWWYPHPLDKYDQWKLLEIAESANPPKNNAEWYDNVELPAKDGWKVVFFYDCGELDCITSFVMPDGTKLEVWHKDYRDDGYNDEPDPPVMLWRSVGDLERLLKKE